MKNKIKEYRNKRGITQKELAFLVNVTTRTIISIEKGQYNPSLMLAYKIACVFDTTIEDICCLKDNKLEEDKKFEAI